MGFKQIYGDTVYGFLFDYKMDYARKLLDSGSYNVNEVGLKIGYSTGSHFISAFKKKFATTPKKYLMSSPLTPKGGKWYQKNIKILLQTKNSLNYLNNKKRR